MFIQTHAIQWEWDVPGWGCFIVTKLRGRYYPRWLNTMERPFKLDGGLLTVAFNSVAGDLTTNRKNPCKKFSTARQRCRKFLRKLKRQNPV